MVSRTEELVKAVRFVAIRLGRWEHRPLLVSVAAGQATRLQRLSMVGGQAMPRRKRQSQRVQDDLEAPAWA